MNSSETLRGRPAGQSTSRDSHQNTVFFNVFLWIFVYTKFTLFTTKHLQQPCFVASNEQGLLTIRHWRVHFCPVWVCEIIPGCKRSLRRTVESESTGPNREGEVLSPEDKRWLKAVRTRVVLEETERWSKGKVGVEIRWKWAEMFWTLMGELL